MSSSNVNSYLSLLEELNSLPVVESVGVPELGWVAVLVFAASGIAVSAWVVSDSIL